MAMLFNLVLALLEGVGIIVSPCILPVLPIIFAVGVVGGKNKPYGILVGFILAFCIFTLFARLLVLWTGINLDLVRNISFILLLLLAVIMMSSYLSRLFSTLTQSLSSIGAALSQTTKHQAGFWPGLLLGLPIGLIWTPCAGPIIAAVIVQTIQAKTNVETVLTLVMFSIGVAIPLLLMLLLGKKMLVTHSFLLKQTDSLRKILGGVVFFAVIVNMQGSIYLVIPDKPPSEQQLMSNTLINPVVTPYPAPNIQGIATWLNSPPLTIEQLKGHVILIDFWTYSCINCVRTLPYLTAWDEGYRKKGLIIIGIHSPEFAFEQNEANVKQAIEQYKIHYPVALDNRFITWNNYANHYWPAHYLINQEGLVVYQHFGEGQYQVMEHNIQVLLGQHGHTNMIKSTNDTNISLSTITPETYLGSARAARFANQTFFAHHTNDSYQFPNYLKQHYWALQGKWQITPQKIITLNTDAVIRLHFQAKKVFLVLGRHSGKVKTADVLLNGKLLGQLIINNDTLYELINLPKQSDGILDVKFNQSGVEAYAFTFE